MVSLQLECVVVKARMRASIGIRVIQHEAKETLARETMCDTASLRLRNLCNEGIVVGTIMRARIGMRKIQHAAKETLQWK